jgi:HSP20 family protein
MIMLLTKWKPAETRVQFKNEFDKLFDSFFSEPFDFKNDFFAINPKTDIEETDSEYVVSLEMPGVDKKDLNLHVENDRLYIKGEKKQSKEIKDSNYICSERSYGAFQRSFDLPSSIKSDKVDAEFRDGILKIRLPKAEEAKKKEIEIKVK